MSLVILIMPLLLPAGCCNTLLPNDQADDEATMFSCVTDILQEYFSKFNKVTYVNLGNEDDKLLNRIHAMRTLTLSVRKTPVRVASTNLNYLVVATNANEFLKNMIYLSKEINWNPQVRFLITIKSLETNKLRKVFDVLLKLHVKNVVVLNGTMTGELYTYNPFENHACGKYYTRVIEYGQCLEVTEDIYPEKLTTGLKNCIFNVSASHWPPYTFIPDMRYPSETDLQIGVDQNVLELMSQIACFKIEYQFEDDSEDFSLVSDDTTISGPLAKLQNNQTDMVIGGMILIPSRAKTFAYIHGYLDYVDEVRIMVKRANLKPTWMNFYLEFSPTIWGLLLLVFALFSFFFAYQSRVADKVYIMMILLDNLLSHGPKFRTRKAAKLVFMSWVWFAFLVNNFYTTSLMSITTKPMVSHQISTEKEMFEHNLTSCTSLMMIKYDNAEKNRNDFTQNFTVKEGCEKFIESIESVSNDPKLYTVVLYSVYMYNKHRFYDEYGQSPVYSFQTPHAKVINAIFTYKGFPMIAKLQELAIRIREAGFADKMLDWLNYVRAIKYNFRSKDFQARFAIPWIVYGVGLLLSFITLGVEVASRYIRRKYVKRS